MTIQEKLKAAKKEFPLLNGEGKGKDKGEAYSYITMDEIRRDIFPVLKSNGLEIIQNCSMNGTLVEVDTYLASDLEAQLLSKNSLNIVQSAGMTIQDQAAAQITFIRRIALINDLDLRTKPSVEEKSKAATNVAKLPLTTTNPSFGDICSAFRDDKITMEYIESMFILSDTVKKLILNSKI